VQKRPQRHAPFWATTPPAHQWAALGRGRVRKAPARAGPFTCSCLCPGNPFTGGGINMGSPMPWEPWSY